MQLCDTYNSLYSGDLNNELVRIRMVKSSSIVEWFLIQAMTWKTNYIGHLNNELLVRYYLWLRKVHAAAQFCLSIIENKQLLLLLLLLLKPSVKQTMTWITVHYSSHGLNNGPFNDPAGVDHTELRRL